jgi:hypothetical protein
MMEFPKMLYRAEQPFESEVALKDALSTGAVKTMIAQSADEQSAATGDGWTEDLASLISKPAKAKAK